MTEPTPSPASGSPSIGGRFAQKYRILGVLGRGGFGQVFLVENELGRKLALKILHEDIGARAAFRERFLREMNLAYELQHENAVPIRDAGVEAGRLYYTMDFIEGRTLREAIDEGARATPEALVSLGSQVLSFLEYLHGRGYIHRDLKPENLMLVGGRGGDSVRVLDLGIAKFIEAEENTGLSQGAIIGTPAYMAPEHHMGDPIDRRIDLYSLGVILYEMACGRHPFAHVSREQMRRRILEGHVLPICEHVPGFPENIERVILKALARDKDVRYSSASEFREALANAQSVLAAPTEAVLRPASRQRRLLSLLLVIPFGGLAVWLFLRDRDAGTPSRDDEAPRLVAIEPPRGTECREHVVEVVVRASESLGGRTRIGGLQPRVIDTEARAMVSLREEGDTTIPILLVDVAGNEGLPFDHILKFGPIVEESPLDARAPQLRVVTPAQGAHSPERVVKVTLEADEELGEGTLIGGRAAQTAGQLASAEVELLEEGITHLAITLTDRSGNRSDPVPYALAWAPPPAMVVLSPKDGEVVGTEFPLVAEVGADSPYELFLDGKSLGTRSGRNFEHSCHPEGEGASRVTLRIVDPFGRSAERVVEFFCDRKGPEVRSIDPPPGTFVLEREVILRIEVDEDLGPGTRIDGHGVHLADSRRIEETVFLGEQRERSIQIELEDVYGNRTIVPNHLVRAARVPMGLERVSESRVDGWGQGWVTPVRDPRTGIRLTLVPATPEEGFPLGAVPGDVEAPAWETPRIRARITHAFYLGESEVTWNQWARARDRDPSLDRIEPPSWLDGLPSSEDHPIVMVDWSQANEFCLSLGMRLPTEAEWEWTCRLEAPETAYLWGDDQAVAAAWANSSAGEEKDGHKYSAPAQSYRATLVTGIYGLAGNVIEWCFDSFSQDPYVRWQASAPVQDPDYRNPLSARLHVGRGGSFKEDVRELRVSRRFRLDAASDDVGFRVALDPRGR